MGAFVYAHTHALAAFLSQTAVIRRVLAQEGVSGTVWATPHDSYSSSIGVLGCKVNTDRIAYWPASVYCDDICVSLSHEDRTVRLLRVDQSQGAFDVSYDAWNYLYTGYSATEKPTAGGPVAMTFRNLPASDCADLIFTDGAKLPLSAPNSMNFLASCLANEDSWVAKNYVLFNILDSVCSYGHDEECDLDWPNANLATCPSTLGDPAALADSTPVYNIRYPTGETVLASSGQVVDHRNGALGRFGSPAGSRSLMWLTLVTFAAQIS